MIGDALIGFIEQSSKFLKGVYVGDTLYPEHTITALVPQRTTGIVVMAATIHNQAASSSSPASTNTCCASNRIANSTKNRRKSCPSFPESARSLRS